MAKADFEVDWDHWALVKWGPNGMPTKVFIVPEDVLSRPGCMLCPNMKPPCAMFPNEKGITTQVNLRTVRVTADNFRGCVDEDGVEFFVVLVGKHRAVRVVPGENVRVARPVTIGGVTFIDVEDA